MRHPIEHIPKDEGQNLMTVLDAMISEAITAQYQRQPNEGQQPPEQVLEELEVVSKTKALTDEEKIDKVHKLIDVPPKNCDSDGAIISISIYLQSIILPSFLHLLRSRPLPILFDRLHRDRLVCPPH